MNPCRVHHSIILIVTTVSIIIAANPVPVTAQQKQFQSTVCIDSSCHSIICQDNLACQSFPPNRVPTVESVSRSIVMEPVGQDEEPVSTSIVMEPVGQDEEPVSTSIVMEPVGQDQELIQPLEDEVAGRQAVIMEPQPEEGEQGQVVEDMLLSDESQGLVNPTTSSESGSDEADDLEPANLAIPDQDTEICEDGLDNDSDGEVDEECDEATSFSSALPNDLTHENEHEEDHHEQFSEEYMRQHDGGDRAEFLEELNEKHDPPFYVPPTNS
jgi:hypothetical protein